MNLPFSDNQNFDSQNSGTPIPRLADSLRIPVEHAVSEYIGKQWTVKRFRDMRDFSSHPSVFFSGDSYSVFVKFSQAANGLEQFELELKGLQLLSELSGVLIPTSIGNVEVKGGVVMVLEAVTAVERTSTQ